ncbi:TPA: phage tail protein [Escherichia coli]|nr:phage tail protein [Escherichia coli]EHC5854112.1 phage tail protein [Escherichia coli]EHD1372869.1 phage tail protein [Escherichia coli]EHT3195712.1 tail fiber protein [Escherichia coli]EJB6690759.1 tail fiber protein [Escherichia coli]
MFYIDNDSGVTVMPPVSAQRSAIVRWFSEGDGNNVITWPGMDWFNIVQAELLNTLEEAGIQPDKTKLNQLALSIKAIMSNNALLIKNNLSEIKTAGASAQRTARENLDIYDASLNKKGLVQLTSATDSPSETLAATAKAVKIAMDNANARLAKDRNGADIPNKPLFIQNVGLQETVNQASGALQKNQNGADIPGKDTFTKNIGACRAYSACLDIGGDSQVWTTAQFISWLESQGAFNHPYWMCKGSWAYANNKVITDTGCGNICLAGAVVEVIGTRGAMTIRVTTPSTSSGGGITNAQFTYINHGDAYAPGWRRDYNTKNQQPAFALGQTGSTVGNDKAVGWNWNSGVYNANIGGASTLILHFNMNTGSSPAVQFRVNYRNGGIFYRSARDGYGFEADWSEFYTTTRKPSAGDVGAYTQAECNSRFITGIRLGGLSSVQTWNGSGWSDRSGYVVTGSVNGNRDELIDTTQARPIQYCINGTWYNAGSI